MARRQPAPRTEPAHSLLYEPHNLLPPPIKNVAEILRTITPALNNPFNIRQQEAFAVAFNQRLSLVWGPPGTGKTTVLAGIILGYLANANAKQTPIRICVGASNYNALDNVLGEAAALYERYRQQQGGGETIRFVRIRSDNARPPQNSLLEDVPRSSDEALTLAEGLESLESSVVIGGTWMQMGKLAERCQESKKPLMPWFDLLVIDEASQMNVPSASAYFLLLTETANVVLAGDHRQLGPIYSFAIREHQDGLFDCIFSYLNLTHRLTPVTLNENYRNNGEIAGWPSERFYENDLHAMFPQRRLDITLPEKGETPPAQWPEKLPWSSEYIKILNPDLPVVVINYAEGSFTLSNTFEAQTAAALACLYRYAVRNRGTFNRQEPWKEFWEQKLGIVTPHRAQIAAIRNKLVDGGGFPRQPAPMVDTVDRFQGLERDLIIASYTVADPDFVGKEDEFILSPRRFNVTLTRARSKFVMLISNAITQYLPADMEIATEAAHLQLFVEKYSPVIEHIELPYVDERGREHRVACSLRAPSLS